MSKVAIPKHLSDLQIRLGYAFRDQDLLQQAITHRSFSADHNERLEFLGDSVLNLAVAHLLYVRLSQLPEGDLSRVRANLVKQDTLAALALNMQLPDVLRLGEGELKSGGRKRPSILADALEAVIGAVYLDGGYAAAQALVERFGHRRHDGAEAQLALLQCRLGGQIEAWQTAGDQVLSGDLVAALRTGGEKLSGQAADKARGFVGQGLERSSEALANVSKLVGDRRRNAEKAIGSRRHDGQPVMKP